MTRFTPIDPALVPHELMKVYLDRGLTVQKALVKEVELPDRIKRDAFRITSSTGKTVTWMPTGRPMQAWKAELKK
jgi:hypothetical protein